jgi:hypothetical protein
MTIGNHRRVFYAEERSPCGTSGLKAVLVGNIFKPAPDLHDVLVSRPSPWTLVIWEALGTKAPRPDKATPHCCYIKTVIFYHRPHIVWPFKKRWRAGDGKLRAERGGFLEWDKVETRLSWNDVVEFESELFDVGGGTVVWARGRWWMCHGARRQQARMAA